MFLFLRRSPDASLGATASPFRNRLGPAGFHNAQAPASDLDGGLVAGHAPVRRAFEPGEACRLMDGEPIRHANLACSGRRVAFNRDSDHVIGVNLLLTSKRDDVPKTFVKEIQDQLGEDFDDPYRQRHLDLSGDEE